MTRWISAVLAMAVGCEDPGTTTITEDISINEFHGFSSDGSWSYRDDGIMDEAPADDQLLRARYVGNGIMDFRRGTRWADASRTAEVGFFLDDRFSLSEWDLGPYQGSGFLPLGQANPIEGELVEAGSWSCTTNRRLEVETYYGTFSDVIQFDCEGSEGPVGQWTFAREFGLIAYDGPEYSLSLVAPW